MRWFVEVASGSQSEAPEKWVVEAAQWQPALMAARSLRGEAGEMAGFSIELLEDGCRAVDPSTFVRYVVRPAPDETPISNPRSKPPPAARGQNGDGAQASAEATGDPSSLTKAARIAAMLDLGAGRPSKPPSGRTRASKAKEAGSRTSAPPRPASQPPRPGTPSSPPPRPASQPPPAPVASEASAKPIVSDAPPAAATEASAATQAPASTTTDPGVAPAVTETTGASTVTEVPAQVATSSASAPVASPPVAASEVGPIPATVEPLPPAELLFQREEDPSETSPLTYRETVWIVPAGTSSDAAVRLLVGMFEGVKAALSGVKPGKLVNMAIFDHRFVGKPQGPPLATLTWKDWKDQGQGPEIRRPTDGPVPEGSFPPPPPTDTAASAVATAPAPAPAAYEPAAVAAAPPAAAVASAPVAAAPPPAPAPLEIPPPRAPTPSAPRVRLSGVELITDLFEAMHTLHFLRDSLEGADFILALVMEKLPSMVGLVHFYDINAREFVVVRAVGPGGAKALQVRTSEKEALIAEAMRSRRAVVIGDATDDPRAQNGRWALIGSCRSLVCAPVEQGGRFLGLLEVSNPRDGGPYHESDGHALTYMGEQFAEFLATRGVVLDPERIGGR